MFFSHDPFKQHYWFEDCPMINPTLKKFIESGKKYLFIYKDKNGEYLGDFYDNEPDENIFIDSYNKGDSCGALFERNFNEIVNIVDTASIEKSLVLIDEDVYEK